MHEIVMEYRRKLASFTPQNKRIWDLAHTMLNEMMRSENSGLQGCYTNATKHAEASRAAENELLELLAPTASTARTDDELTILQEASELLRKMYDKWENGDPSFSESDDPLGNACQLGDLEGEIIAVLNKLFPPAAPGSVPQAEPPKGEK